MATTDPPLPDGSREPWLAANLSLFFPGLGQWYAGAFAAATVTAALAVTLYLAGGYLALAPRTNGALGMLLLFALVALWLFSIWHAHRIARATASPAFADARRTQRDAWKGLFLTRILPGLGQLYDRRLAMGALLLAAALVLLLPDGPIWDALFGCLVGISCLETWTRGRSRRGSSTATARAVAIAAAVAALGSGLLIYFLKTEVVRAFRVPSASMAPTIRPGDFVLTDLRAAGQARIGDIVAFPFPEKPSAWFLKTVFAVGGDLVEFRSDGAYRNRERVVAVLTRPEDLAHIAYGADGQPFTVPEGAVFLLGDNYLASNDSRFFGPLPTSELKGRAYKIYWPPGRARAL